MASKREASSHERILNHQYMKTKTASTREASHERILRIRTALCELDVHQRYHLPESPNILGKGAYGMVVEAVDRRTGHPVAIKHVSGDSINQNTGEATRILREVRINVLLRDENHVVKLLDTMGVSSDSSVMMVYEMGVCDLFRISHYCPTATSYPFDLLMLLFDVSSALHTIHSRGVIHRDVKLSNLIMMDNGRIALADFGISGPNLTKHTRASPPVMTSYVQTRGQRAPELLYRRLNGERERFKDCNNTTLCKRFARMNAYILSRIGSELASFARTAYNETIDIWSFGCVVAELILQESPFGEEHNISVIGKITWNLCENKAKRERCRLHDALHMHMSDQNPRDRTALVELILWMLSINPLERPSAIQILDYMDRRWPEKMRINRAASPATTVKERPDISNHISHSSIPHTIDGIFAALDSECKHIYGK